MRKGAQGADTLVGACPILLLLFLSRDSWCRESLGSAQPLAAPAAHPTAERGSAAAAAVPAVPSDVRAGPGKPRAHFKIPVAPSSMESRSKGESVDGVVVLGLPVGFGFGAGVCVGVGAGVPVGVGVVVAGGVVTVSDGTGLGAGWVGTGVVTPGTGTTADGTAEGTQTGSASETCGVGRDDGD